MFDAMETGDDRLNDQATRQFILFRVDGEAFALPLENVREIIRVPIMAPVPLTPTTLLGVSNLRGNVLPIVSLRRCIGFADDQWGEAARVLVFEDGGLTGLVVDQVCSIATIEAGMISPADGFSSSIDSEFLTGVVEAGTNNEVHMILDGAKAIQRAVAVSTKRGGSEPSASLHKPAQHAADLAETPNIECLLSFLIGDQGYALPIDIVREIISMPETITAFPEAPAHFPGMAPFRGKMLPLIDLRRVFIDPGCEITDASKIIVATLRVGREALAVGLIADLVQAVVYAPEEAFDALFGGDVELLGDLGDIGDPAPAVMGDAAPSEADQSTSHDQTTAPAVDVQALVTRVCRLDDGERVLSILNLDELAPIDHLQSVLSDNDAADAFAPAPVLGAHEKGDVMSDGENRSDGAEEQFVVFRLGKESYGVPIASVQEIVRTPEKLTRVPQTPDFVEGVVNLRGAILPVIDARKWFGIAPQERNDRQRIIVFVIDGSRVGFIVDSVSEVMRFSGDLIGPAPQLFAQQSRAIERVAHIEAVKKVILLLNTNALFNDSQFEAIAA